MFRFSIDFLQKKSLFFSRLALMSLCLSCFFSCSPSKDSKNSTTPSAKIKTLSTIAMINDIVKSIGGDHVEATILIRGELDPHSYQLVKGDDEKFASSHLIFYNGLGLEHGPSLNHLLQTDPKAIALGDKILKDHPTDILYQKGQLDPHIWMDVELWSKIIPHITQALIHADPQHAVDYQANSEILQKTFAETHTAIRHQLQSIPKENRFLVTSHDAFNYFTRAYLAESSELAHEDWQKRFAAPEGLAPESQLSVTDIQLIIDHLKTHHIHVIFPESNVSKDSIKKIVEASKEKGINVVIANAYLYADAMGKAGSDGDTYIKMIQHNANAIESYLKQEHTH